MYTNGRAWVDLGDFTGSCIAEPSRCREALTVFLWLKYYPNRNKRYFVGTSSHLTYSEGFTIYKESDDIANNTIVLKVNDGQRVWNGSLTLKPKVWSHVMFTWEPKSGLAIFQNCNQIALASPSKVETSRRNNRSNVLEHHLSLSRAQMSHPGVGARAMYEDLTVLYRKMTSYERKWVCRHKLGWYI